MCASATTAQRTVRYVSEILEVMPPGDTERPAVNRLFLPEGPAGRAIAAHTPSPADAGQARGRPASRPRLLDQHRPRAAPAARLGAPVIIAAALAGALIDRRASCCSWLELIRPRAAARHPAGRRLAPAGSRRPGQRLALIAVAGRPGDAGGHPLAGRGAGHRGRGHLRAEAHLRPRGQASHRDARGTGAVDPQARRHADGQPRPGRRARGQRAARPRRRSPGR